MKEKGIVCSGTCFRFRWCHPLYSLLCRVVFFSTVFLDGSYAILFSSRLLLDHHLDISRQRLHNLLIPQMTFMF